MLHNSLDIRWSYCQHPSILSDKIGAKIHIILWSQTRRYLWFSALIRSFHEGHMLFITDLLDTNNSRALCIVPYLNYHNMSPPNHNGPHMRARILKWCQIWTPSRTWHILLKHRNLHENAINQSFVSPILQSIPESKVHGANVGPTWGRQDPGGPHVGHMNFVISDMAPIYKAFRDNGGVYFS